MRKMCLKFEKREEKEGIECGDFVVRCNINVMKFFGDINTLNILKFISKYLVDEIQIQF